jgi:hypothetical protein
VVAIIYGGWPYESSVPADGSPRDSTCSSSSRRSSGGSRVGSLKQCDSALNVTTGLSAVPEHTSEKNSAASTPSDTPEEGFYMCVSLVSLLIS